eukprot:1928042-Prorocentrum_lima.AAC.1
MASAPRLCGAGHTTMTISETNLKPTVWGPNDDVPASLGPVAPQQQTPQYVHDGCCHAVQQQQQQQQPL